MANRFADVLQALGLLAVCHVLSVERQKFPLQEFWFLDHEIT